MGDLHDEIMMDGQFHGHDDLYVHVNHGSLQCDEVGGVELRGVASDVFRDARCVVLRGARGDHESSNQEREHEVHVCVPIQSLDHKLHDKGVE